jgi:hypothetical protein
MSTSPPEPQPGPAEPGYTTTEFWLTAASAIIAMLIAFNIVNITTSQVQSIMGVLGVMVPIAIYTISRGLRKNGTPG